MKRVAMIVGSIMLFQLASAQSSYQLPFASTGNVIELAVANGSTVAATNVTVSLQNIPLWLQFDRKEQGISSLGAGDEHLATFRFAVDKSAPVGQEQTLGFVISNFRGERWAKEIRISVTAPEKFELYQNYPNPFNPTTTISYQLSVASRVNLKIFNLLGQDVVTLVDGEQAAGYHRETFDAKIFASGLYIYQLIASSNQNSTVSLRKAMLLLK